MWVVRGVHEVDDVMKDDHLLTRDDLDVKDAPKGWKIGSYQVTQAINSKLQERMDLDGSLEVGDGTRSFDLYKYPYGGEWCDDCRDQDAVKICTTCWGTGLVGGWRGPRSFWVKDVAPVVISPSSDLPVGHGQISFLTSRNVHIAPGDLVIDSAGIRWAVSRVVSANEHDRWLVMLRPVTEYEPAALAPLKTSKEELQEELAEKERELTDD